MNAFFKFMINIFKAMYKVTNGRIGGRMAGLGVLLLTTRVRKSGLQRTTPLGFFEEGSDVVIIASNAGSDHHPDWYFNLKADPNVTVRINDKEFIARATETPLDERNRLWEKLVSLSPMYGRYATSTQRVIPMIRLHPAAAIK